MIFSEAQQHCFGATEETTIQNNCSINNLFPFHLSTSVSIIIVDRVMVSIIVT
jgi:hypothetical protein